MESFDVEEGSFASEDLHGAEEAFLASTARLAQPIAAIGEAELAAAPGPWTLRVQEALRAAIAQGAID